MSRTILVADDSPTIRKIVELTFTDTDIRVEVADSGSAALDRIDSLHPDLVLADVFMPDPTGYDLCRTIKSSDRPVPVVLLAGTFEPFDSELAQDCGADAHLVKPFESEVLLEKVRTLLDPPAAPEPEPEPAAEVDVEKQADDSDFVEQVLAVVSDDDEVEVAVTTDEHAEDAEAAAPEAVSLPITQDFVDSVADAVVRRISSEVVREIANEVVPRLATEIIRERIRELEQEELEEDEAER